MSLQLSARRLVLPVCALLVTLLAASYAHAHRVNIFAWVEGTTIHTEATFNSGNKAQKSHVTATDKGTGVLIAEGDTNTEGIWSFTLPADVLSRKPDILVSLSAGEGHANTWLIAASDYADATPGSASSAAPQAASDSDGDMPPFMEDAAPASAPASSNVNADELRQIVTQAVDAALEKKLAPIRRQLAEEAQHGPTVQDIMGGIGYIFGLMGIAAYMRARKK
ncbi:hypothetical protein N1030_02245 [Desulfovibrio mangrovi]|uniref:hypothetical protein n=1 Tax=Desulfovibrio mangrovi TaxID=2976983 RepID=UPI00224641A5|nr:hypothetical protein [Desulfovibrio mangrovi]UZP67814.1 hypothetical protein N1030_02245 [Desulfovibrio mangrovi]